MKIEINQEQFKEWLQIKGLNERSIQNYMFYYNKFNWERLEQSYLTHYLQRNNNGVARAFLKNIFLYIKTNEFSAEIKEATRDLDLPKLTGRKKKRIPKVLSKEEVHTLAKALESNRDKIMLLLSFYCGLRLSEMLNIKPYDLNWSVWQRNPLEPGDITIIGKGNKERKIPVMPWLMERIMEWIKAEVSENQNSDKPVFNIKERRWQSILTKTSQKILGRNVNPHLLRHSCATYLMDNGLELQEIADFLGHESITTTAIYTHVSQKKLKNKVSAAFS